jgi:hypothetical protein
MRHIRLLTVVPIAGIFIGPIVYNSVTPLLLRMPFILAGSCSGFFQASQSR